MKVNDIVVSLCLFYVGWHKELWLGIYKGTYLSHYNYYTITNYFRYKIQIEVVNATNKTTFVIFDWDAEKILNKSARDLVENKLRYNLFKLLNYCKTIDHNIY